MSILPQYQNLYTTENIIKNYQLLSSEDAEERERANKFLMSLADHEETWVTCQNMIQSSLDPNFVFLGAQLLYQKIQRDLHQFDATFRTHLKNFLFSQLDSGRHIKTFIIDKLASSAALIVSTVILEEWPGFMQDLTEFMKKSQNHLLSGLILLERIPEQLRSTNRISQGVKSRIQENFLKKEELFAIIFDSVLELSDINIVQSGLKTMQSWIRVCYPLMRHPHLVQKVLVNSLQDVDKLETCIKVICEAVKLSAEQKSPGLSEIDPAKQQQNYSVEEIKSIQTIVTYVLENRVNFLGLMKTEPESMEIYLQLIQQLLLSFGFLIMQSLGFQLLDIILQTTRSADLKLSYSTFEFWTDFSEKVARVKLNPQVKEKVYSQFVSLLDLFSQKLLIQNESLMTDADLKDDDTVDDAEGMTFTQYRQDAAGLLRAVYDYLVKVNKEIGAETYFKKVVCLIQSDSPPLTRHTELALYMLKSPLESIINPYQTHHLTEILSHLILLINKTPKQAIAPIVLGETMNFIRDCTRQIKQKQQLFLESLRLVLNYINDEKLCHHAAYCFQILMETINTLNDTQIAESLVQFYCQEKFTKQVVLEKMLEGIYNAVIKVQDPQKVEMLLDVILQTIMTRYHQSLKNIILSPEKRSELYLTLVELKTLLDAYDSTPIKAKSQYGGKFTLLANKSVEIVNPVLTMGIVCGLKFSSVNEIGLAVAVYRVSLKILQTPEAFVVNNKGQPIFIDSVQAILTILNQSDITQYFYLTTILSETLIQFINHESVYLNQWLQTYLNTISEFYLRYFYHSNSKTDPDVIKSFFTILESLLLYNMSIFAQYKGKQKLLSMGLNVLKLLNERNMQRKVVSFLLIALENNLWEVKSYETIVENIFVSIPIIHSMCYNNLAKMFKILFKQTTLEQKEKVFAALLTLAPYHQIDHGLRTILSKAIAMALATEQQRNIKTVFAQLHQIVWKRTGGDVLMQLQLKIAMWKRQYKKLTQGVQK